LTYLVLDVLTGNVTSYFCKRKGYIFGSFAMRSHAVPQSDRSSHYEWSASCGSSTYPDNLIVCCDTEERCNYYKPEDILCFHRLCKHNPSFQRAYTVAAFSLQSSYTSIQKSKRQLNPMSRIRS